MVTSELTGEVSIGVLLVFLVSWRRGRYIGLDQQGDNRWKAESLSFLHVLLVWGVVLASLLIKTRQSSDCDLIDPIFNSENCPIKR